MSRRYQTILTSIFDDLKIRALDEESRWVFVYLLICKHANLPGLFMLPMSYITRDIQYSHERVSKAFANLSERQFIEYDTWSETVFVRTWLRHKPLDNPNKVKGALAALEEIPDSPLFSSLLRFLEEEKPNGYETLSKALRNRLESLSKEVSVSVPVSVPVSVVKPLVPSDEKTPKEPDPPKPLKEPEPEPEQPDQILEMFGKFWAQYPRKDKKVDALKAWKQIKKLDEVFDSILYGLAKAKMSQQWNKDRGQFIPLPATWIRARQWDDQGVQAGFQDSEPSVPKSRYENNMDVARRMIEKGEEEERNGNTEDGQPAAGQPVHCLPGEDDFGGVL